MRLYTRLALASGGALLLSFATVPFVQARQGSDDQTSGSSSNPGSGPASTTSTVSHEAGDDSAPHMSGVDDSAKLERQKVESMRAEAEKKTADAKRQLEKSKEDAQQRVTEAKAKAGDKLDATKLRVCQNREQTIGSLMTRISARGNNHVALIGTISERIQTYVTDNNLTVANYDALLAAVANAETTAKSANEAVKAAQPAFKCDGTDPNGAADSFKALTKAREDAVKAYRDAVKTLLTAVKASAPSTPPTTTGGTQ